MGKASGRGPDRLKLGTFVAARQFSRQPTDMTAEAGERRAADSQDPSRSDRWCLRAQAIMMGLGGEWEGVGGEKNGGKMAEEMSGDSIKTQQTSVDTPRQSACQLLLTSVLLAELEPRRLAASSGGKEGGDDNGEASWRFVHN